LQFEPFLTTLPARVNGDIAVCNKTQLETPEGWSTTLEISVREVLRLLFLHGNFQRCA
jgi:hypothetical protein